MQGWPVIDPHEIASRLLGDVDWQTEVSGFCRCPGASLHTSANGKRDCRVNVDGAPTIFCFHASCASVVAEANRRLRRELGASPWELRLPGGQVLRSGDVLQKNGEILARPEGEIGNQKAEIRNGERLVLESLRVHAERFRPELFEFFRWPMAEVLEDSPLLVAERDAEDQFRTWLKLWPACSTVWVGDVYRAPANRSTGRISGRWRSGTRLGR